MTEAGFQNTNTSQHHQAWRTRFFARLDRLRRLMVTKWWLVALGIALGVAAQFALYKTEKPLFISVGRMIVSMKLATPEGSVFTEELSNFLGTQAALMQSELVVNRAQLRVLAQSTNTVVSPTKVAVTVLPRTTIFVLQAMGNNPAYTRAYLQACMDEYIQLKKEMRTQTSDTTLAGLTEEVLRLQKDLRNSDESLVNFQTSNSVVLLQEQGNSAGTYLTSLNQRLASLKSEYDLLETLTVEQSLERRQGMSPLPSATELLNSSAGAVASVDPAQVDYFHAKQQVFLLKADQEDLSQYLRPKHPKMIALADDIARRERLLKLFREQSVEQLESYKSSLGLQIKNLEKTVAEWDAKCLQISRKTAEYERLKADGARIQSLYDRLLSTMQTLDVNKEISPESVTIMEQASPALPAATKLPVRLATGAAAGLALAFVVLLFIDRLDDRLTSFTELQDLFTETILAQIPREKDLEKNGPAILLENEDQHRGFVEAYRNLRSSLLFMGDPEARPRSLVVTSSVPSEGKSSTASHLAATLASTGSRVLLIDADLRKGELHSRFDLGRPEIGLSDVLAKGISYKNVVLPTKIPNLSLLPRGPLTRYASELFLSDATGKLLKEVANDYNFVIVDTAPVMAADDVASLAPHVDGTLFVLRADHTSARVAHTALDVLYQRKVNIMGIIFNAVRPSTADYYYYKYHDYYYYQAYPEKS